MNKPVGTNRMNLHSVLLAALRKILVIGREFKTMCLEGFCCLIVKLEPEQESVGLV